jgi:ABC-type multidrug transport system fused ATPase/permease subunit
VRNKGLLYILVIVLGFLFNFFLIYLLSYAGQTIIYNIRNQVFSHLQKMPLSFFDKNPVGRLVTRVTNDTETLNDMYTNVLVNVLKDISIMVGVLIIMLSMDLRLSLVVIAAIPPVILATILFRVKARKVYRFFRVTLAKVNSVLSENLSGMRIIQLCSKAREKYNEFKSVNKDYYKAGISQIVVFGIFRPLLEMIEYLAIAAILWYGGINVIGGTLKFGVLYAFINYLHQFFSPITDMAEKYNILQSAMASSERIFMILDAPPEQDEGSKVTDSQRFKGEIEFRNVWFSYNEEDWVLKDVSFSIPAGNTVAIVGATGAGKTSIISLLGRIMRFRRVISILTE